MKDDLYIQYCQNKTIITKYETNNNTMTDEEFSMLADMKFNNTILEEMNHEFLQRYNMERQIFDSFTPEQRDFICYQIGSWYLMWTDRMWVHDKPNQHYLGMAKEQLKIMICGE